jgi:hypothetical protein
MIVTRGVRSNAGRKKVMSGAVSLILLSGLAAYGARAFVGVKGVQEAPVAGFASGSGKGGTFGVASHASSRRMPKTEMEVAVTLGLNNRQMAKFIALDRQKMEKNAQLKRMRSGHFAYGAELNVWWNSSLKSIFTKSQYAQYCAAWGAGVSGGDAVGVYSPARPVVGRTNGGSSEIAGAENPADAPFGGKEKEVLANLGLSDDQTGQIDALYAKIGVENQKLREIWKGDDPDAVGRQGSKINRMQNEGMKAILTPEQHQKYLAAWGQVMKPYLAKGAQSARRPVVGGQR